MTDLKLVTITNPVGIGVLAPLIQKFLDITKVPGLQYEHMYTYIANLVQFGKGGAEVCAVMDNDKPVGFGVWRVKSLPYVGVVACDFIYSHNRQKGIFKLLTQQFIKFGIEHRCPWYSCVAVNPTVAKVIEKMAEKLGLNVKRVNSVEMFGWKHERG